MIAAAIPDDRMNEMITKKSEITHNVESFSQKDIMYTVQINEAGKIASCPCYYFKFNSRAFENVSIMETLLSELGASSIPENEFLASTAENNSNINATSILKRDIKLDLDSLHHLKRRINAISDYEFLTDIKTVLTNRLQFSKLLGTDQTSKFILKHHDVKSIVTKVIVDIDGDAYRIGDAE
ncbi:hypothetical protein G6F46_000050 [Rhizopus delemar]|uniref:Uncharacterized protein n=2 Tax=Rhizopus TaxID=4842 RepID=A0A9P6ZEN8_9FUNG|nr:hypothetical protein G6F55_001176 [Rhizopus delemar]KAG1554311.1 hypothetical protein G6F51_000044 [Rhizopus arrhizus]KAG1505833.1 hypothetical protein G6F54_000044 [Rhizopus delemar]KAG1519053.1 hypothetical protein G6F53_000068 [Rhizopus delemar]KAG1526932.1 hypothetical protein G6F52_001997 [Rhizopus delemar]